MKKLILILLLIIPSEVEAHGLDFSSFRPDLASTPDRAVSVSIPIVPYFGINNVFDIRGIKRYIDLFGTMSPPPQEGDIWTMFHIVQSANKLKIGTKLKIVLLPSLNFSVNSKHIEFSMVGGASGYLGLKINRIEKELRITDIKVVSAGPTLGLGAQKIISYNEGRVIGFESWIVGKHPIRFKKTTITPLLGFGFTFGHYFYYDYEIYSYDSVSLTSGLYNRKYKERGYLFDLGALVGIQWDTKYLKTRAVIQSANLFSLNPDFDLGLSVNTKILNGAIEIRNFNTKPSFIFEINRGWKNSEIALGIITNSNIISKDFGYLNLSFGGRVIKATTTFTFNDKEFGILIGTNVGYYP